MRDGETLDEAAQRKLAEQTGVAHPGSHLEQLASYGNPKRDPRMPVVSFAYIAIAHDRSPPVADTDAALARF